MYKLRLLQHRCSPHHEKKIREEKKEAEVIYKGHDEGIKLAVSLLQEFDLPLGLLPLTDVIEVGFIRSTGYMWILQKKKTEHVFKVASRLVSYDAKIHGYVEKNKIRKLKGVKTKELMLWPPVSEIYVDDPPSGKIRFKSLAGISRTFPVEAFVDPSPLAAVIGTAPL